MKIMNLCMVFFVGAFIAQSTRCMHGGVRVQKTDGMQDEEHSLIRRPKLPGEIKLSIKKIFFARPAVIEGTDEVSYAYLHELPLKRKVNFYIDEKKNKGYLLITSNDLHTLPFTKLLNLSEKEIIERIAAQSAVKEYEDKMSLLQKYPKTSALVVGTVGVAAGFVLKDWLKK
jgi:hypothetical protein